MELAREGTLKKLLAKSGPLKEDRTARITEKILMGLDYLHNAGVLHKDLKPTNVLMMPKDEVKLTDYGLAELYDERLAVKKQSEKEVGFMRGDSLPYMAPEVIKNIEITDRSDVWSVGCTVVEMVTGKVPWGEIGSTFEETFQTIAKQVHPPLPQKISKECRSFL